MANYKKVGYDSQGSDVTELQKLLNQNGNQLDADGNFGSKAQASTPNGTAFQYGAYKPSDAVSKAQDMIQQQLSQKPGAYKSQWQAQLDDTMKKILNREKFSYDLNGDALYHQYKDMAVQQGRQAMMDTMGQAAALTGGYGNSYAQSVGQQAYQGHLQQLNDVIPELYQMAHDKYTQEGNDLMNQFGLLADREVQDYGRHQDSMDSWSEELARLQNRYDSERSFDYGQWADGRDFGYGQFRDETADKQWQAEFDEAIRRYNFEHGITEQEDIKPSGGGSGSGGSGGGGNSGGLSQEEIKAIQKSLGLTADGVWGPETQAAAKAMWGVTSAADAQAKYSAMKPASGELSANAQKFMNSLPYPHGGSDISTWNNIVDERLGKAYEKGALSESDVTAILKQLNLV